MSLDSPLLEKSGIEDGVGRVLLHRHVRLAMLIGAFGLYFLLGALERLAFTQMVHAMPTGVLLMHTLLSLMGLALFVVLQLARSQGGGPPVKEQLQRLSFLDLLQMAFLDTLHTLLAFAGGTQIPGVVQIILLQATFARQPEACACSHPHRTPAFSEVPLTHSPSSKLPSLF
jgi:hypothetical protein